MHQIKILPIAELDLEDIEFEGALEFGHFQALKYRDGLDRLFDNLAFFPLMGTDLKIPDRPEWRKFPYGVHIVIYSVEGSDLIIRRVLSARMQWQQYI